MIKRLIIVSIAFPIAKIIISCCSGVEGYNFNFSKITLTAGDRISHNLVSPSDSISYSKLIIQIDFDYTTIASNSHITSFDLYAYDCEPIIEPVKKITDIKIITLNDFNNQLPSGSEISVNYEVYGYTDMGFNGTEDFVIHHLNSETSKDPNEIVYFKLIDQPDVNNIHRFSVTFLFDDNSNLSDTTSLIYLKE